jgi:hypothetical protein
MKQPDIPCAAEQAMTTNSLVMVAANVSEGMDKFVLWMITGFGAGLTYLLGKDLDRIANFKVAGYVYLAAIFFAISQRYLTMLVTASAKGFKEGEKLQKKYPDADFARFLIIYINSLPVLQQPFIAWIASQIVRGDLVSTGRALYRLALFQMLIGSLSCLLLLWTAKEALQRI